MSLLFFALFSQESSSTFFEEGKNLCCLLEKKRDAFRQRVLERCVRIFPEEIQRQDFAEAIQQNVLRKFFDDFSRSIGFFFGEKRMQIPQKSLKP